MVKGREKAEWWRLSQFMAFIGNRMRFSDKAPVLHPDDLNPFARPRSVSSVTNKEHMASFHANNPIIPLRQMVCVDGQWVDVDKPTIATQIYNEVTHGK